MGYPLSPNRESRHGTKIDMIVLHSTVGNFTSAVNWLTSTRSKASAHYVIGRDGTIANLVPEDDAAWHCGTTALANWRSIGIELVDDGIKDASWFTEEQHYKLNILLGQIIRRWDIPVDRNHIKMHKEIKAKGDPVGWTNYSMAVFVNNLHNYLFPIAELEMEASEYRAVQTRIEFLKTVKFSKGLWLRKVGVEFRQMRADGSVDKVYGTPEALFSDGWQYEDAI
jgi:N-acetylmuramoyl-L-alanine amidase CwlA